MRRHQHGTLDKKRDSALWHNTTYDVLELRGIIPVSDWQGDRGRPRDVDPTVADKGLQLGPAVGWEASRGTAGRLQQVIGAARSEEDQRGPQCDGSRFFASGLNMCACFIILTIFDY